MQALRLFAILGLLAGTLSACTTDDYTRVRGLTPSAGNASAANTVMQMVDPWQPGVQDPRLIVPAVRPESKSKSAAAGYDVESQ